MRSVADARLFSVAFCRFLSHRNYGLLSNEQVRPPLSLDSEEVLVGNSRTRTLRDSQGQS